MLRRLLRTLLLFVALLGLMPGFDDLMEQAGEIVEHGHLAHSTPGEPDPLAGEHGCTPVQHHCRCHQSQSFELARLAGAMGAHANWLTWMLEAPRTSAGAADARFGRGRDDRALDRANAPPIPPPNA